MPVGDTPAFMAASELYKALSAYPQYRSMYFDEEASKVLDSFNASAGNGSDPKSAYVQAYQAISPEAKAAADLYVSTPAFKKMAAEESQKWVTGSGMNWLRLFGGNGRPQNPEIIGASVMWEMRSWRARNPHATAEQAAEYAEHWTEKNFVIDKASRTAVRIPPGVSAPAVQEAISANSKRIIDQMKLSGRSDADWSIQYLPTGTEGNFNVVAFNGSSMHQMGAANIQTLLANHAARTQLDAAERTALGSLRVAVRDGTALPQLDTRLIAKAEALGILKPAEIKAYRDTLQSQLVGRLESVPKLSFGAPAADGLQFMAGKPVAVDKQLTAKVALEFAASPMFAAGTQHVGLAASLISMGEGVVLGAYDDPAQGAGKNIGMGYNLKANEKTASSDLKRAGVPEERIAQVIKGEAQLTADQAKRLLQVAMPRYEKQAQETAEASSPGLWSRMAPAQKAVMIDVAWQTGNPEKFKKAWAAVVAGDSKALAEETRVFYTDRSGERREDVRRNSLRASMLAGVSTWEALVSSFGKAPSSKVQAAALGTSK